jgi:hypothetical protein
VETIAPVISLAWAAFWIALAAVIISGRWLKLRREALKYDTIVRLAEKTGRIDEEQFKVLFPPPDPSRHWFSPPAPGSGRVILRILGTLVIAGTLGLGTTFLLVSLFRIDGGVGLVIILFFFGAGLFVASRFARAGRGDREAP